MRRIVPEAPAWLAAVGAVGDLGDAGFALDECHGARPKNAIKKLVSLVNAPRRLPDGPVRTALALLVEHDDPREALKDPRVAELEEAKAAWRAEFDRVVRTAPQMVGETVAVLRFSSPAQVHPLVATTWSRRLAPRMVLAANDGYLGEGTVNFAVRGGEGDLRRVLREALPIQGDAASHEFAHGHDRATGGSLPDAEFERLLAGLARRAELPDALSLSFTVSLLVVVVSPSRPGLRTRRHVSETVRFSMRSEPKSRFVVTFAGSSGQMCGSSSSAITSVQLL
jgi:single-stranded-DNA-specific exonuclease